VDKDGRKVFSDQGPPSDVPANRILKQPGGRAAAAPPVPAEAAQPVTAAAAQAAVDGPKLSGKDKDLEARKKIAEGVEADKRKAEEALIAAARSDNCERSKRAKTAFDSGVRIARSNAQGEREYLDDRQREAEAKRLDTIIVRDCK
jgi:hypothetical protein